MLPKHALYQAELYPDEELAPTPGNGAAGLYVFIQLLAEPTELAPASSDVTGRRVDYFYLGSWSIRVELNHRPLAYQASALTN